MEKIEQYRDAVLDFVYPASCVTCGQRLTLQRPVLGMAQVMCRECASLKSLAKVARPERPFCASCFSPTQEQLTDSCCLACLLFPGAWDSLLSAWWYQGNAEKTIKAFKYAGQRALAKPLAEECVSLLHSAAPSLRPDLVVPMPSGTKMLRHRGFFHTGLLAKKLAALTGGQYSLSALTVRPEAHGKHRPQADLPVQERAKNVKNLFVARQSEVSGKVVLLVDDVVTSGASANAAATTLKAFGAREVHVLTLCRASSFYRYRTILGIAAWKKAGVIP